MNKSQIVANELSKITTHKLSAELKAKNNLIEARKEEEFLRIDSRVRETMLKLSQAQDNTEINALHQKLDKLNRERSQVLARLGLNEADLAPQYYCKICEDSGYIDGKPCECLDKAVKVAMANQSGLANKLSHTFATSDSEVVDSSKSLAKAYALAQKYVEAFPTYKYPNLVFLGDVGSGKTYLLECIANALINKSHNVAFCTAFDLNQSILNSFNANNLEREAMLAPFFESELLIIDDLGSEPFLRNATVSNLFTVLNKRQTLNLPTIISTNLSMADIQDRYGDRVMSRIFNKRTNLTIQFTGKDLRLNKN